MCLVRLEVEEVPLAYRRCQPLSEESYSHRDPLQSHQKQMPKGQSRGTKYSRRETMRAVEIPWLPLDREGNNSSVCLAVRKGTLPGVQPMLLSDKHVIKEIFAQNSCGLQQENHESKEGFYVPHKSTGWRAVAVLLSWPGMLCFAISSAVSSLTLP